MAETVESISQESFIQNNLSNNKKIEIETKKITVTQNTESMNVCMYVHSYIHSIDSIVVSIENRLSFSILYFLSKHNFSYLNELAKCFYKDNSNAIRTHIKTCLDSLEKQGLIKTYKGGYVPNKEVALHLNTLKENSKKTPLGNIEIIEPTLSRFLKEDFAVQEFYECCKRRAEYVNIIDDYIRPEPQFEQSSVDEFTNDNPLYTILYQIPEIQGFTREQTETLISRNPSNAKFFLAKIRRIAGDAVTWDDVLTWIDHKEARSK